MTQTSTPLKGFDETSYLAENADVAGAIARHDFKSGYEHFVKYGYREERPGLDDGFRATFATHMRNLESISPPVHLIKRVHGADDVFGFDAVGRTAASDLAASIGAHAPKSILDFGCGCGRVMRHLWPVFPKAAFSGSDIDGEAIKWCDTNLGDRATFAVNAPMPPLPFEDSSFDFVYAVSVFTHLPEDMQFSWLEELRRVTMPGGIVALTTHGEKIFAKMGLNEEQNSSFRSNGFFYYTVGSTDGLPDFYRTTFHTHGYIEDKWSKYFDVTGIIDEGMTGHQDIVMCQKR
jgi:ubiquinone/menaquinone biosynthesis C-methylase UbiE